ncbi:hypothetical protein PRVXH_000550 [Proteinivorax hydrogeniformans]|uniref:Uncharacterized protein n=1 Tax=Proteinivorax hydrogeniformans TaxID=1826727 RepID=A0AAU8HV20_9FIRM
MRDRFDPTCIKPPKNDEPEILECIITTKVYDACRQTECEFFAFKHPDVDFPEFEEIEHLAGSAEIAPPENGNETPRFTVLSINLINGGPLARVRIEVCADINLTIVNTKTQAEVTNTGLEVCFTKDVVLWLPEPERMEAIAESIFRIVGEPIFEEVESTDVEEEEVAVLIPVGAWIIIKSTAEVQLLIPTFGFCPTPPVCEEFPDPCEDFEQLPFPEFYPPQPDDED